MVSTSAGTHTRLWPRGWWMFEKALGGVCLIAGGMLSIIGMKEPKSA